MNKFKNIFDIKDKIFVITGGGGFIAKNFAKIIIEYGGKVILIDNKKKNLHNNQNFLSKLGLISYDVILCDISNEKKLTSSVKKIVKKYKKIDVLINTAALTKNGIDISNSNYFSDFQNINQKLWKKGIDINLNSTQLICKIVGNQMIKQKKGNIINIASDVGVVSPNQNIYKKDGKYKGVNFNTPAFYAISKAAIIHLTKVLATEWASFNVRVNCISPAGIYRNQDPNFVKKLCELIPMKRMAREDELNGAIIFLSSESSSFITGHNLIIDGGRTVW